MKLGDDSLHYSIYFCACSKFPIIKKFLNAQKLKNILKQIRQNCRVVYEYLIHYYLYLLCLKYFIIKNIQKSSCNPKKQSVFGSTKNLIWNQEIGVNNTGEAGGDQFFKGFVYHSRRIRFPSAGNGEWLGKGSFAWYILIIVIMNNKNNNNIYIAHITSIMCQAHYKCSTHTNSFNNHTILWPWFYSKPHFMYKKMKVQTTCQSQTALTDFKNSQKESISESTY